eukprot:GHUV01000843.1.p1 GENE.GHUV01000843.1~~GHUV01000843.1.p1  ORF type:complete len:174 (+),score=15.03 GHUV01000843.1:194-715(+)
MHPAGGAVSLSVGRNTLRMVARGRQFSNQVTRSLNTLAQQHPLIAKMLPTAWGYMFGECLTQQLGPLWPADDWPTRHDFSQHDLSKTAMMGGVGAFVGAPLSLILYRAMDAVLPGASFLLAAGKFTLDQVVGCILWQAAYLAISEPYRTTLQAFLVEQQQVYLPQPMALVAAC